MNTFFTNNSDTKNYFNERQKYIKETLLYSLSENLKECEYLFKTNQKSEFLELCDATNSLCTTLEAIFLHGQKQDSFTRLTRLIEDDHRPSPSFWSFVCIFLQKHAIDEIQAFTQVKTNVGYCRVFIRSSLNESLLSSYFQNIRKSQHILKNQYQNHAFLNDYELVETVENLLLSIENYASFKLPLNSSLLNVWNDASLSLAGIYSAPMRSLPLAYGEDAVTAIPFTNSKVIEIPSRNIGVPDIYAASISNSIFSPSPRESLDMDDDENLSRILVEASSVKEDIEHENIGSSSDLNVNLTRDSPIRESIRQDDVGDDIPLLNESIVSGNSIIVKQCWSEPMHNLDEEQPDDQIRIKRSQSIISNNTLEEKSYMTLFNEKQRRDTLNFKEVWEKFQKSVKPDSARMNDNSSEKDESELEDFEIIRNKPKTEREVEELQYMVELLCRLSNESGLDAQGFMCNGCKVLLGIELAKATVCQFDGHYYCSNCISNDKFQIPAKIIYNWDFKYYPVSKKAEKFLTDYQFKPFIDFKILNPVIYSYIDQMNRLQKLRIQLNYIRAYLFTCSESDHINSGGFNNAMSEIQKSLYGKEYIYESIHLYSTADLTLISSGALEEMLCKIVSIGKDHCLKCVLCSVKGFICEYCRKSRVIYPFEVDDTFRCNNCATVSHLKCYNPTIPCPKCERKKRRQTLIERSSQ